MTLLKPSSLLLIVLLLLLFSLSSADFPPVWNTKTKISNSADPPASTKISNSAEPPIPDELAAIHQALEETLQEELDELTESQQGPGPSADLDGDDFIAGEEEVEQEEEEILIRNPDGTYSDESGPTEADPDMYAPEAAPGPEEDSEVEEYLKSICEGTEDGDLCILKALEVAASLEKSIQGPSDVLGFQLSALYLGTQLSLNNFDAYLKNSGHPAKLDQDEIHCVEVCKIEYREALKEIELANKALDNNSRGELGSFITGLFARFSNCGAEFDRLSVEPMFEDEEKTLMKQTSICMTITAKYFHP